MSTHKNPGGRPRTSFVCDPAVKIVDALGGIDAVAQHLELSVTAVTKWGRPRESGGGGGQIPVAYWKPLIAWSKRRRSVKTLAPADFVEGE